MIAVATTRGPQRRDYSGRLRECNAAAVGCSPDVVSAKVVQVPTFGLHALKGDSKGTWAVAVRADWRVIFRFEDGQARDVDLADDR